MLNSIRLQIAEVNLSISCPDALISPDSDPSYQSFISREKFPSEIEIMLKMGDPKKCVHMTKLFDTEKAWSIYRNIGDYYIVHSTAAAGKPLWVAEMNSSWTHAAVYCSDCFVKQQNGAAMITNPVTYPLDQIILMYYLSCRGGALFHAAGIGINKIGYIFAGRSGAGKTTISKQFITKNYHGLLSDDRVIVRKINNQFKVFGTPWPGEGGIASNTSLPLSGIFFLSHGDSNRIEKLNPTHALEKLLPVVSVPWYDQEVMPYVLSFCEQLISHVPSYMLRFRPDTEVVDVIEKYVIN